MSNNPHRHHGYSTNMDRDIAYSIIAVVILIAFLSPLVRRESFPVAPERAAASAPNVGERHAECGGF